MIAIPENEIENYIAANLKNWALENGTLKRNFKFKSFVEAFSFMTAIALEAEKMDHHPEWTNTYNQVTIKLNTHSVKGITSMDFDLAKKIDIILRNYE